MVKKVKAQSIINYVILVKYIYIYNMHKLNLNVLKFDLEEEEEEEEEEDILDILICFPLLVSHLGF